MDEENFGQTVSIELRPGGKETRVTDENKDEYIQVKFLGTIVKIMMMMIIRMILTIIMMRMKKKTFLYIKDHLMFHLNVLLILPDIYSLPPAGD